MFASRFGRLIIVSCALCVAHDALAGDWNGKRIMPKNDTLVIRTDGQVVGDAFDIQWPATVKTVDGRWLWVADDGGTSRPAVAGWVSSDDVQLANEMIGNVTSRLSAGEDSAALYWLRGIYWETAREPALALKDFREALRLNPNNRDARLAVARTQAKEQYNEQSFQDALRVSPACPRVYMDWGQALEGARRYPEARDKYLQAARLNPNWRAPHYALGQLAAGQEEHREALSYFEEAIRRDPTHYAAHRGRAASLLAINQTETSAAQALAAARRACECCYYREAESLAVLAAASARFQQWSEAQRFQLMAVEYSPVHVRKKHQDLLVKYVKDAGAAGAVAVVAQAATELAGVKRGVFDDVDAEANRAAAAQIVLPTFVDRSEQAFE